MSTAPRLIAIVPNSSSIADDTSVYEESDGMCQMVADADIDADGVDDEGKPNNIYHDPFYQSDTTLHHNGKPLNALQVPYIVLPNACINGVKGIVMGCLCRVTYYKTGKRVIGVVGDKGPSSKTGELSIEMASRLEMGSNPNSGGEDVFNLVRYEWWPGIPAIVDDIVYTLQPA